MIADACASAGFLIRISVKLFIYLRYFIPIILVVFIIFDLSKVVVGQVDEKAKKDAASKIVKRIIYAVIIFFIPTLVNIVLKQINTTNINKDSHSTTTSTSWYNCWMAEYNK